MSLAPLSSDINLRPLSTPAPMSVSYLPPIPDDLTVPQFIFHYQAPSRPIRPSHVPWLIEDHSGRKVLEDEVRQRTYHLAYALRAKFQLKDDDVVCLFSVNDIDYLSAIWAVHLAGGVITPSNPAYTVDELVHQLKLTETTLIIVHPVFLRTAEAAAKKVGLAENRIVLLRKLPEVPNVAIDDLINFATHQQSTFIPRQLGPGEGKSKLAFLSFSSGTTGKPKAVAIPHHSVIANVIQAAVHYKVTDPSMPEKLFTPDDVVLGVLPLFHIYGLVYMSHTMLFFGLSLLIVPKFSFKDFLDSLVRHRVTHLFLVPPQVVLLCKASLESVNLDHVKYCVSGAAPLNGELMVNLRKILPNATIGQGYGMTETCTTISLVPPDQKFGTIGSAGRLIPGVLARVVKSDGTLAKEGEAGELLVTGPSMALGYYKNPSATKETFIDGWVHTGDEVMIKNSEVFILDRIKEMIKVRGYQVAPAELEGHLLMRPDVADACVVGVLDEYSGELPLAYVVPDRSIAARIASDPAESLKFKETLIKYVAENKTHYKRLAGGVELIDTIPKNPSGKILRRILRDKARAARACPKSRL